MEDKYLNFDGSQWTNDGTESIGAWNNQAGQLTEEQVVRVSEIYGTALNQTGQGGDDMSSNMVLSDDDNSSMPDSDVWSNHPGLFGITWSKKKAESEREAKEQVKVNASYPNTGSCAVLTSSLDRLNGDIAKLEANKDGGGKGAKRENARARKTRKIRKKSVTSGTNAACEGEEAAFQRDIANQQEMVLQSGGGSTSGAASPLNLVLGLVVLGGIGFGIYKLTKK